MRPEPEPINIAYTNCELDSHLDLPYYESPPGIQMLHCLENNQDVIIGGESLLLDVHHCAALFREEDPEAFQTLCEVPATFIKNHLERENPAQMFYRRPHFSVDSISGDINAVFWSPSFEGECVIVRACIRGLAFNPPTPVYPTQQLIVCSCMAKASGGWAAAIYWAQLAR